MTYQRTTTDDSFTNRVGKPLAPVVTFVDEAGHRAHIVVDDGCYVLCTQDESGHYLPSPWLFDAAVHALGTLPPPSDLQRELLRTWGAAQPVAAQ